MLGMRPFQIILVTIFAVLAVIGLYVFSTFSGFGGETRVGVVKIWGTLPAEAMENAIGRLKQEHREFENITYIEKRAETFDAELANALAAGTGPDLIILNQEHLLVEKPRIEIIPFSSISQRSYLDTYLALNELYLTPTGTYAVPLVVDPLVLYYNRSILSSVGVAMPPATWEAVTGLVSLITKQTGGQAITRSTVAFGSYTNVTNARAVLSLLLLQAGSAITQNTTLGMRSTLAAPSPTGAAAAPAESALNFYTQFANPAKTVYSWNPSLPSSRQAFLSGDLAFYLGYASEVGALRAANPNLDFDMAAIPQPATNAARKTYGLGYAFSIPKVAANKSGAYSVALGLTASDILPALALELGMAPAKRAMLTTSPAHPFTTVYYPEALNAVGWLSPAPAAVDAVFTGMITNITTGRYDTPQALTAADQSLNAALQ